MYNARELEREREKLWPSPPRDTVGIEWREAAQLALCRDVFAQQPRLKFTAARVADHEYFTTNGKYPPLDAWVLEGIMRWCKPRQMIEVGCGYSTLVSARVNREFFDSQLRLTCVEPYPPPFLSDGIPGITGVRVEKIQDTPLDLFATLQKGDILFVDTGHTVKTGGDVTWIFHEIIPRLAPGVMVHVHDFFLPGDYPQPWVFAGWGWNETYLARSFLTFNDAFEIVWGTQYMLTFCRDDLIAAFPDFPTAATGRAAHSNPGASLWMRRRAS